MVITYPFQRFQKKGLMCDYWKQSALGPQPLTTERECPNPLQGTVPLWTEEKGVKRERKVHLVSFQFFLSGVSHITAFPVGGRSLDAAEVARGPAAARGRSPERCACPDHSSSRSPVLIRGPRN